MEVLTLITELLGHVAWPAAILALVIMFRREIRQRLTAVTELKYPGGSIIMREVERLEAKVEGEAKILSHSRKPSRVLASKGLPAPHRDSRLAIAQIRLDSERELFLLSRHALGRAEVTDWSVNRYIEELEKDSVLEPGFVDNLRDFVDVANQIVHLGDVPDELIHRAAAVGSSLVATLRHKRLVEEAKRNFEGHGLWHMFRRGEENGASKKYYYWSAVAASLPEFDYDYEVYREAAEDYNSGESASRRPGRGIYVLSLEEFVSVLEYREQELLRIIDLWGPQGWDKAGRLIEWQWPSEWGPIDWTGPILRERAYLWGAEEELLRTRAALRTYRPQLLAARRSESQEGAAPGGA